MLVYRHVVMMSYVKCMMLILGTCWTTFVFMFTIKSDCLSWCLAAWYCHDIMLSYVICHCHCHLANDESDQLLFPCLVWKLPKNSQSWRVVWHPCHPSLWEPCSLFAETLNKIFKKCHAIYFVNFSIPLDSFILPLHWIE